MLFLFIRKEVKTILPEPILKLKTIRPQQWTTAIHDKVETFAKTLSIIEAKVQFLSKCQSSTLMSIL